MKGRLKSPCCAGLLVAVLSVAVGGASRASFEYLTQLSAERMVFQTDFGRLEMAFYPKAAPLTVKHILEVASIGGYNTNHFFRVDKNFVAQVADITGGRSTPPDERQRELDLERVPLEVHPELKHHKRGLLSMARHSDPNSGGTSFSVMLHDSPHLDMQYAIFGEVVSEIETLARMEEVETTKSGIFVMPKERVQIHSSYVYTPAAKVAKGATASSCEAQLEDLQHRFVAQSKRMEAARTSKLP